MILCQTKTSKFIDSTLLTVDSNEKKDIMCDDIISNNNNDKINKILDDMYDAFKTDIKIHQLKPINIELMKNTFIDFDKQINNVFDSKFQMDILKMNDTMSVALEISSNKNNYDTVTINFIFDDFSLNKNYMAVIIHALNTFCNLFDYNYNGLVLDISLDDNSRKINLPKNIKNYDEIFDLLKQKSGAFNASGVTYRKNKKILLTKKEEIIKLMYHELIHYIGFDQELMHQKNYYNWAVNHNSFNLSEAYTEFLSVILNVAYETIHICSLNPINRYDCFKILLNVEINYSLYLIGNILKFYGYDCDSFYDFFNGIGEKKYCPIYIWEYVILRTQLFMNLDSFLSIINNNFRITSINKNKIINLRITSTNKNKIINLMKIDNNLLNKLAISMTNASQSNDFSYLLIDISWNLI